MSTQAGAMASQHKGQGRQAQRLTLGHPRAAVRTWAVALALIVVWPGWGFAGEPAGVREFLRQHCVACHGSVEPSGGLDLSAAKWDLSEPDVFRTWVAVVDRVRDRKMPPAEADQPLASHRDRFTRDLGSALLEFGQARQLREGRTVLRRLNRIEYENTVQDLLGIDVPLSHLLPGDGSAAGFDTVSEGLRISAVQIEKYLAAADVALDAALRLTERPQVISQRYSYKDERDVRKNLDTPESPPSVPSGERHRHLFREVDDALVFISNGYSPDALRQFAPKADGEYRVRISAYGYMSQHRPVALQVFVSDWKNERLVGYFDMLPDTPRTVEFTVRMTTREHLRVSGYGIGIDDRGRSVWNVDSVADARLSGIAVRWVEVEGPVLSEWPPPSVRMLCGEGAFRKLPQRGAWTPQGHVVWQLNPKNPGAALRESVVRFAERAFRRPLPAGEADRFVRLGQDALSAGQSWEAALRVAVRGILVSPRFLILDESPGRLDDFAIASRLSYFLWSTMPDAELLSLAGAGRLSEPAVLRQQVSRMLDSPRSAQFVRNFVGQWLDLRRIDATAPDRRLYPEFDELLRVSMLAETEAFFAEMLAGDLPVTNLIDSDFAMLNSRLARHYGIPFEPVDGKLFGEQLRRVTLPADSARGGVLTQAAVLKVTANGTVTSPVVRGAWVLRRILGTPPSPPPPVAAIEPDTRGATTIRELLARHRDSETCNSCHRFIDPPGFALESFDVIGGFRERYRSVGQGDPAKKKLHGRNIWEYKLGPPVDASGQLADGRAFADVREFKALLLERRDQVLRSLTRNLVTYATGARVTFADRPRVDRIATEAARDGGGLRSLVAEIVTSDLFLMK